MSLSLYLPKLWLYPFYLLRDLNLSTIPSLFWTLFLFLSPVYQHLYTLAMSSHPPAIFLQSHIPFSSLLSWPNLWEETSTASSPLPHMLCTPPLPTSDFLPSHWTEIALKREQKRNEWPLYRSIHWTPLSPPFAWPLAAFDTVTLSLLLQTLFSLAFHDPHSNFLPPLWSTLPSLFADASCSACPLVLVVFPRFLSLALHATDAILYSHMISFL